MGWHRLLLLGLSFVVFFLFCLVPCSCAGSNTRISPTKKSSKSNTCFFSLFAFHVFLSEKLSMWFICSIVFFFFLFFLLSFFHSFLCFLCFFFIFLNFSMFFLFSFFVAFFPISPFSHFCVSSKLVRLCSVRCRVGPSHG